WMCVVTEGYSVDALQSLLALNRVDRGGIHCGRDAGLIERDDRADARALRRTPSFGADQMRLIPAIETYAQVFNRRSGIEILVQYEAFEGRFSSEVESMFFRILQQALRTARSTRTQVTSKC